MLIKLLKPFSFVPAILLMYMIYSFSAQDGASSSQLSYQVSYKIVEVGGEVLGADLQPWEIDKLANRFHVPVRKLAHMTEYFLLAVAVAFPLYVYGLRGILLLLMAGMICVGFACGDEYHQAHVAGRGPSKRDVLIDSVGVFFGIILVRIIGWTGRKTVFRPFARKKKGNVEMTEPYRDDPHMQPQIARQQAAQGYSGYPGQPGPTEYRDQPGSGYPRPPYPQGSSCPQGKPYPQGNFYSQGDPYPRENPCSQGDPYPQGNSYPQDNYRPQGDYYYERSPQEAYLQDYPDYYDEEDDFDTSDRLSEDMSLRKLVSDLKGQKQARRTPQRSNRPSK